jgi:hypothetical protein
MRSFFIIPLSVVAAVIYGILHDQVTARICVEYFTIGHDPVFGTDDPTLLGLGWGVIATWWVGALLGVPLAIAARAGSRPKRDAASLVRPIACLLAAMALCAVLAGFIGWGLARAGVVFLVGERAREVPPEKHIAFIIDIWAHSARYIVGFVGGLVLLGWVWRSRRVDPSPDTGNVARRIGEP